MVVMFVANVLCMPDGKSRILIVMLMPLMLVMDVEVLKAIHSPEACIPEGVVMAILSRIIG